MEEYMDIMNNEMYNAEFLANPYTFEKDGAKVISAHQLGFKNGAEKQKAIDDKRTKELLEYLEELEAHYRQLGQYDDGKPIRRVIEYIKSMEKEK